MKKKTPSPFLLPSCKGLAPHEVTVVLGIAMKQLRAIYGIDFSGAKDAGKKIWIAKGTPKGKGLLIKE